MNVKNPIKINTLLQEVPSDVVLLSSWLSKQGYSFSLQQSYKESRWLESVGSGAVIRYGDNVDYLGALYALQHQAGLDVHVGGRTALALMGKSHYVMLGTPKVVLFGTPETNLPKWFNNRDWGNPIGYHKTSFVPKDAKLIDLEIKDFTVKISSPPLAMFECLYLTPKNQELVECYQLMEFLNNLIPKDIQWLLENCSSVKVKRLFLYLAAKANHQWFNALDLSNVDLGKGKRSLVSGGVYVPEYEITVSRELAEYV